MLKTLLISTAFLLALMACSSDEPAGQPGQTAADSAPPSTMAKGANQETKAPESRSTGSDTRPLPTGTKPPATLPPQLAKITAPAVNKPLAMVPPTPLPPIEPKLPEDGLPALQPFIDGKPFAGTFHSEGDIKVDNNTINMDAGPKGSVSILYRMPREMGVLASRTLKGELDLYDLTTVEDRNRAVSLSDETGLFFAETSQRDQSPIDFQIHGSLKLQQTEVGGTDQSGTLGTQLEYGGAGSSGGGDVTSSRVDLVDGDTLVAEIQTGTAVDVESPIGTFKVFIEESLLSKPAADSPGVHQAYVLRLWIARLR